MSSLDVHKSVSDIFSEQVPARSTLPIESPATAQHNEEPSNSTDWSTAGNAHQLLLKSEELFADELNGEKLGEAQYEPSVNEIVVPTQTQQVIDPLPAVTRSKRVRNSSQFQTIFENEKKRWGKSDDRQIYFIFIHESELSGVEVSDIISADSLTLKMRKVLRQVFKQVLWKGTLDSLFTRIKKLNINQRFSVRETKAFKRLVKVSKQKFGFISMDYLKQGFPGKSELTIRAL